LLRKRQNGGRHIECSEASQRISGNFSEFMRAVRGYFHFQLSLRDIEALLFERGVIVTYETNRCWCDKFGARFAHQAKAARRKPGGCAAVRGGANAVSV